MQECGWSSFEDCERLKIIMSHFNEIQRLIYVSGIENHPEIIKKRRNKQFKKSFEKRK
tara:strand:+ start:151 stop:324 length:174 start_codon:yes stop_codon:yes gene_type:complete